MDYRTATFQDHRRKLYGIAYRMLGSKADVEDALQETYMRWHEADVEGIRTPEAWLTTTLAHLCIDRLRAERAKRETYVGPWLPEPLVGAADAQLPGSTSDLSMAFLVMLERLAPKERAAFLLHDVFEYGYSEIARILDKTEAAARQIVHRARERVRSGRRRFAVSDTAHRELLEKFVVAVQTADRDALARLFASDATWTADGGGKTAAASKVLHGGTAIAKLLAGLARQLRERFAGRMTYELVPINGETGILFFLDDKPAMALSLETDGERIVAGFNVVNPDKLARVSMPQSSIVATRPFVPSHA